MAPRLPSPRPPSMTSALFLAGTVSGRSHVWPLDRPRITVGRSEANEVQLLDDTVSREHAEIVAEGNTWLLRDLGGKNGTRVNGVPARRPVVLRIGDRLAFGRILLCVTDGSSATERLSESKTLATALQIPAAELLRATPAGRPHAAPPEDRGFPGGAGRSPEGPPVETGARAPRRGWSAITGLLRRKPAPREGPPDLIGALAEIGALLVLRSRLGETCDRVLRSVEEIVPAARLVLLVRPGPDANPVQMAARSHGEIAGEPLLLSRTILSTVMDGGSSVITTDAMEDTRFRPSGTVMSLRIRSAMAVPLLENGRIQGLLYADQDDTKIRYDAGDLETLTLIGNMIAVKVANDHLVEAEEKFQKLEHEMEIAGQIQRGLLPPDAPDISGYECHAVVQPCEAVGGDLYDVHPMPDGSVYLVVADVSGEGIAAALLMTHFLAFTHALYEVSGDPADLVTRLNALMAPGLAERGYFVSAIVARLKPDTGVLQYANAGHPPGMLIVEGGVQELPATGPPCGILADLVYPCGTVEMPPGGLLALYTDGIPDTRRRDEYFEARRLEQLLVEGAECRPIARLTERVLEEVNAFLQGEPRQDDVTLLLLRNAVPSNSEVK